MGRRDRHIVHEHLQRVPAEHIREEVRQALQPPDGRAAIPADLATEYIVTTFILVLQWCAESRSPLSAREVDDVFLALVAPALTSGVERSGEP
jgi:hypothetical protein